MEFIIIVWRRDWFEQQMRAMNSVLVVMQILHCRKDTEYGKAYKESWSDPSILHCGTFSIKRDQHSTETVWDETIICKRQAGCMHHRSSEPQKIWSGRYWWNTGKPRVDEIIKRNWIKRSYYILTIMVGISFYSEVYNCNQTKEGEMNMKKKILLGLVIILCCFTGCSSNSSKNRDDNNPPEIKMSDIDWSVKSGIRPRIKKRLTGKI